MSSIMVGVVFIFFFKQKTAYEMRISDWSSDVCSSDLRRRHVGDRLQLGESAARFDHRPQARRRGRARQRLVVARDILDPRDLGHQHRIERTFRHYGEIVRSQFSIERIEPYHRSEEHTSELQSLMRLSYEVFCLTKKTACKIPT